MKYYLMLTVLCCGLTVLGADKSPRETLNDLKVEQKKVAQEIYKLRLKLIKEDPALAKLHKKIMELHREMALKLESKKSMRIMVDKASQLDQKIKDLEKKVPEETEE
ncbi:hypothetical protein P0136_04900 [Lentisphaerota bacterium ZTH]|nr:hypothetical protein JYG24_03980 [Lentisphaerota bacterium]WET07328.1 hypothetical protein P0136_04900 [Lentisphaerota bacterium ZTH]